MSEWLSIRDVTILQAEDGETVLACNKEKTFVAFRRHGAWFDALAWPQKNERLRNITHFMWLPKPYKGGHT